MTGAWSLLAAAGTGAVGAAVVGVFGAWIGARLQRRDEHSRWLRDQRLVANKAFYEGFVAIYFAATNPGHASEVVKRSMERFGESGALDLLGPPEVAKASEALTLAQQVWLKETNSTTKAAMEASEAAYLDAARRSITKG